MADNSLMASRPALTSTLVIACCTALLLVSMRPAFAQNTTIDSFNKAKKLYRVTVDTRQHCTDTLATHIIRDQSRYVPSSTTTPGFTYGLLHSR